MTLFAVPRAMAIAWFVIAALVIVDYGRLMLLDPRWLYATQAPDGAREVILQADGSRALGLPRRQWRRGETVGWSSALCLEDGVTTRGVVSLIHVETGRILAENRGVATPGRCHAVVSTIRIPDDAPLGEYTVRRIIYSRRGTNWPELTEHLTPVNFVVVEVPRP